MVSSAEQDIRVFGLHTVVNIEILLHGEGGNRGRHERHVLLLLLLRVFLAEKFILAHFFHFQFVFEIEIIVVEGSFAEPIQEDSQHQVQQNVIAGKNPNNEVKNGQNVIIGGVEAQVKQQVPIFPTITRKMLYNVIIWNVFMKDCPNESQFCR